jgi:hypothetical protein
MALGFSFHAESFRDRLPMAMAVPQAGVSRLSMSLILAREGKPGDARSEIHLFSPSFCFRSVTTLKNQLSTLTLREAEEKISYQLVKELYSGFHTT